MAIPLYLDTNVLCRPFDDQTVKRIRRETEAFERILSKISDNQAIFVTSDILLFEVRRIISAPKRAKVTGYLHAAKNHQFIGEETFTVAGRIMRDLGLGPRDSLHIASALLGGCEYFLTCDDGVTKKFKKGSLSAIIRSHETTLGVINPVIFVGKMGW